LFPFFDPSKIEVGLRVEVVYEEIKKSFLLYDRLMHDA
jgi:hypothetical protein